MVEPLLEGEPMLLVFGDAPMLLLLGAVLSEVLGEVVVLGDAALGEVVLGDVVLGEVVLEELGDVVVLGEVALGAARSDGVGDVVVLGDGLCVDMLGEVGDVAPADELGPPVVPVEPVLPVCA